MATLEQVSQCVVDGDVAGVQGIVKQLIDAKTPPMDIINKGLVAGMNIVAPLFKSGEMFVPEVMESAETMNKGMELVKPLILDTDMTTKGKIMIGTVNGDLHDIGKNLLIMMIESSGYTVIDLGVDVKEETFVSAIKEHQPDIVGMSSMLTTTMMKMESTVAEMVKGGVRDKVKVIIGGAPISPDFVDEVKADGYAEDASTAVELCDRMMASI
ncbi:cobalamin B12-binding domain-containing protein [Acetobacterium woodii]|uniref:Corrinoid protein MttC19 n=1 Tax=Acetobacterium woodii (strain ATCC 29683 / DSM 1030 / JCM 2381 / KCTC 1655 / WB1) TaxID=931626 RepID=H6LCR1_ACEWD|nr:corrinoid protein [Acetobacterium woodii]AFA49048.1 corrinoid protein MttC19 [Acetobacterium woodii DSM 1030]